MTVAVFGASGFIGSHLIARLKSDQIEHVGFSHRSTNLGAIQIDFENPSSYAHLLQGVDTAVLLVTQSRPGTFGDSAENEVVRNVLPYARFVEIASASGIRRVVYLSSGGAVYGTQRDRTPITEDHPTNPISPYGVGKLMIETMLRSFLHKAEIALTVLRPANPVGSRQQIGREGLVASAVYAAREGRILKVWGDGSVVRDYFPVADLADAIVRSFSDRAAGNVYNVGSGVGASVNEVLDEIERITGSSVLREYSPGRHVDAPINVLSSDAIRRDLGWHPTADLRQIVEGLSIL